MPKQPGYIRRAGRALEKERLADFTRTRDITEAIYGNLQSFIGDRKSRLTSGNVRTMAKMQRLLGRMKLAERRTGAREQDLARRYGGMLAEDAAAAMAPAEAVARGNAQAAKIGRNVSRYQANTGEQVLDIAQAGAQEAQAGADYATAQALSARTKEDVAMLAQMEHEIRMATLQHEQQMERDRVAFRQAQRAAEQEEERSVNIIGQGIYRGSVAPTLNTLTGIVPLLREYVAEDPDITLQDAVARLVEDGVITEAETGSAVALLGNAFNLVKTGGFQNLSRAVPTMTKAIVTDLRSGGVEPYASFSPKQWAQLERDLQKRIRALLKVPRSVAGEGESNPFIGQGVPFVPHR